MAWRKTLLRSFVAIAGFAAAGLGFIYWYDATGQRADPTFDARVPSPTYPKSGPRLAFDVAHRNWHRPDGRYLPLAQLLRNDGYEVVEHAEPFSAGSLASVDVLLIANAMGPDDHEGSPAFTESEDSAVVQWVEAGGSLLLIADHSPFGSAAARLARQFGITMYLTFARDDHAHAGWDNEKLIFSRENGLLGDHPITVGRNSTERVSTVATFTGQSLSVPDGATALLRMGDDAYDWESRTVRTSARGHAQGVAMSFGRGRIVVLGEAAVLSAQVDPLGFKMGMNQPGNDNRQFALNIAHWLSGAGSSR